MALRFDRSGADSVKLGGELLKFSNLEKLNLAGCCGKSTA